MCVDIRNNLLSRMLVFTERRMGERGVRTGVVMRHGHSSQLRRPRVTCHHPGPVTSRVLMSSGPGNTRATPPTPGHVGSASGVPCFVCFHDPAECHLSGVLGKNLEQANFSLFEDVLLIG